MKAVILAAAKGERLHPFTENRPKTMIRVAGKALLETMTASLRAAGIKEVVIVVHHQREAIQSYFQHGHKFGISIEYVVQEELAGIGDAVKLCEPLIQEESFLLIYGDIMATGSILERLLGQYMETGGPIAALSLPESSSEFGNVYLNPAMKITQLVEKPKDPHLSNYVFAGLYVLPHSFFGILAEQNSNMEKSFQQLISQGALSGSIWEGDWIDLGRPWDILKANRILMGQWDKAVVHKSVRLEGNVQIEGPVHIEENVVIGSGSVLKGPCYIGNNSYIGNNTLIREYTSLGPNSTVGYGTELKNCVLLGSSILGRLSYIGDSVIGERVHMGSGVMTVNVKEDRSDISVETESGPISSGMKKLGAFIGDDVFLGARHVIAPGTIIKSGYVNEDLITIKTIN